MSQEIDDTFVFLQPAKEQRVKETLGIFEDDDDDAELVQASDEPSKEQIFDEDSNDSTPANVLKPLDGKSSRNSL